MVRICYCSDVKVNRTHLSFGLLVKSKKQFHDITVGFKVLVIYQLF